MKKAVLAIGLFCGVFAARAWVVTNTFYIVTNEYHYVYYTSVITQQVKNTHAEHYFTNYYYEVTNIQVSTVQNIYRTNFNYNVIWDNFDPWVLAASNYAVNAQSAASSAASSSSSAWAANSSASSFSSRAAASAAAAASSASDGLTAINERVNWFDNHVIEAIRNANTLSNMNVVIDAPGASATYTYLTQRIDNVTAQWNTTKTNLYDIVRLATGDVERVKADISVLQSDFSDLAIYATNTHTDVGTLSQTVSGLETTVADLALYATNTHTDVGTLSQTVSDLETTVADLAIYATNNIERLDAAITNLAQAVSNDMQNLEDRLVEYIGDSVSMSTAWSSGTRITLNISTFRNISQNNKVASGACLESPATLGSRVYTVTKAEHVSGGNGYPSQYLSISPVGWYQGDANIRLVLRFDYEDGTVATNWLNTGVAYASNLFKTSTVTRSLSGNNLYGGKDSHSSLTGLTGTLVVSPHGTY